MPDTDRPLAPPDPPPGHDAAAADYAAFVSYSHRDARRARWLHRAIETYRLPRKLRDGRGARVGRLFLDRSELPSSASLAETIKAALARSRSLIVICSPASAASRWVNEEIRLFRAMGRGDRIFCLVVDGIPGGGDPATEAFPPALFEPLGDGGTSPAEPLAADIRPDQDRPGDAKLKIVAGLLGVSFDDLRQREATRRQRRLIAVAAVTLVLMLAMLALTIAAVVARNQAERQRLAAVRTTEFLQSLFRISDPDEARGAHVTAREILDHSARQLTGSAELRDQPAVRASLLTTLAGVYVSLGLYGSADRLAGIAGRIEPQDEESRARRAIVVGEIALQNSDYPRGERALAAALPRVGRDSPLYLRLLLTQGELYKAMGRAGDAERVLVQARETALRETPPDRDSATKALASLAGNDFEAGRLDRAQRRLRAVVAQRTALDGPLHSEVLWGLNTLGTVALKRGDLAEAEASFRRVLPLERRVLGANHNYVAISQGNLARALVEQRRFAEAATLAAGSLAMLERSSGPLFDSLANINDTLGLAQAGLGRTAMAEESFARGVRVARYHRLSKEGELLVDLAELRCRAGTTGTALVALDQARTIYAAAGVAEPWRAARWASVRGGCLLATGDRAAARPLILGSVAAIRRRWGADSLFGTAARDLARRVGS